MTPKIKKRLFDLLRILICVGALWIVIQGVTLDDHVTLVDGSDLAGRVVSGTDPVEITLTTGETRLVPASQIQVDEDGAPLVAYGLKTAWSQSRTWLLLLAVAIHLPVVFFQGLRIRWMLRAQDIELSFWEGVKLSWAGNFLNFATPLGSNAGDVFKAYFVSLHTEHKTEAVTTVVLDRIVGLGSLLTVVALITVLSPSSSRLAEFRPYMLAVVGAGFVGVFLYFSPAIRKHLVPRSWLEKLPMHNQLRRIDHTARNLMRRKAILAGSIFLTVVLQATAMGAYFTVAVALGMDAKLGNMLEYYAYFYVGAVIQALPGPPQGLGTVELAYRYFFSPYGNPSQIVCVAFVIRLVVLTCAVPGLLVAMTGAYRPREAEALRKSLENEDSSPAAAD